MPHASLCDISRFGGYQIDGPGGRELRLGTPEQGNERIGSIRQFCGATLSHAKLTGLIGLISSLPEALLPTLQKSSGAHPSFGPWLGMPTPQIGGSDSLLKIIIAS